MNEPVGTLTWSHRVLHSPAFKAISFVGWIGMACLLPAIFIVVIAAGVQNRPGGAPQTGPFDKELRAFTNPSFAEAMSSVVVVVFVSLLLTVYAPKDGLVENKAE